MKPCMHCGEPMPDYLLRRGFCANSTCSGPGYNAMVSDIPIATPHGDRFHEAKDLIEAIHALPIEHDNQGHAFKRIPCRSMNDLGAWVDIVRRRLENFKP